jgi:hypothetical protein
LAEASRQKEDTHALLVQAIDPKTHRDELRVVERNSLHQVTPLTSWARSKITPCLSSTVTQSQKITAPGVIAVMKPMADQNKLESIIDAR